MDVRFTPDSGDLQCKMECPLWAKNGLMQRKQKWWSLFSRSAACWAVAQRGICRWTPIPLRTTFRGSEYWRLKKISAVFFP